METAALILQGRDDYTASEPVAGVLPLLRIIRTLKYAGIKRVVLAGEEFLMSEAFNHATKLEAEFIYSTIAKRRVASYRTNALIYLKGKCDRLLIVPAYYPLIDITTVKKIAGTDAALAAPVYKGKRGYPVAVSSEYFDGLIQTDGDLDGLLNGNAWEQVEVDDEGVTADVTKKLNAEKIAAKLTISNETRPGFKLALERDFSFYGPGMQEMIRLVEETGSLKQAFTLMGMSTSNGRRLIAETEASLGFTIFDNKGDKRSGSVVSDEAKAFSAKYSALCEDCVDYLEASYKRHFG